MGRDPEGDKRASRIVDDCRRESRLEGEERSRGVDVRISELLTIGRRCAEQLREGPSAVEHGEFLYDEHGLPK